MLGRAVATLLPELPAALSWAVTPAMRTGMQAKMTSVSFQELAKAMARPTASTVRFCAITATWRAGCSFGFALVRRSAFGVR